MKNKQFDLNTMLTAPTNNPAFTRASEVHAEIMASAKSAQENLYNMAMGFKKMRDEELYKALGYNSFGDYCEKETGMKRRNVYNYIAICEKLPSEFVQSTAQIGMQKLQLLTTISEQQREEIVENNDLESTSVRELKAKIEELKQHNTKLQEDNALLEEVKNIEHRDFLQAQREAEKNQDKINYLERKIDEREKDFEKWREDSRKISTFHEQDLEKSQQRIKELEQQIKDLESRPVEVAVQEISEDEKQSIRQEVEEQKAKEIDSLKAELSQVQNDIANADEKKITFDVCLNQANNALKQLLKATINYTDGEFEFKNLCDMYLKNLNECLYGN